MECARHDQRSQAMKPINEPFAPPRRHSLIESLILPLFFSAFLWALLVWIALAIQTPGNPFNQVWKAVMG